MSLQLILDHAQPRLDVNRNVVLAQGSWPGRNGERASGWSTLSTSCYRDPITFTGMLRAGPWDPAYHTTGTGIYARLRKTDFTLTSADWTELTTAFATDYWLSNSTNEAIKTTTTWAKNRGFFVAFYQYNSGREAFECFRFGWSNTANDTSSGVWGKIFSDGFVEIYKGSTLVGTGNIGGDGNGPRGSVAQQWTGVSILPFRKRELLIFSDKGAGFTMVFDDIDEEDTDPIITPATKFWVMVPNGAATIQVTPLMYPTSGNLVSVQLGFGKAPLTGATLATPTIYYDKQYTGGVETAPVATLVETDGTTPFVANAVRKDCCIKLALVSDGTYTPFVYGCLHGYAFEPKDTNGTEEIDIAEHCEMIRLDVPEEPTGISIGFTFRKSADISVNLIERMGNRPVKLLFAENRLFDGRTYPPMLDEGISDEATMLEFEASAWKVFERFRFPDVVPLDGATLEACLDFFLDHGRMERDPDSSDLDFTFPQAFGEAAGNWNLAVDVGDTSDLWIRRLRDDFAPHCKATIRPQTTDASPRYWIKTPEDIAAQAVRATLYSTIQEAIDEGGFDATDAYKHVYRKFREEPIEPEANDIRVTGWDPKARRPIQSHKEDFVAQLVGTEPSARDENWQGEPLLYGLVDGGITTQAICDEVCERLYERLTPIRRLSEIEAEFQFADDSLAIWPGDLIELFGKGVYVVNSLTVDFVKYPHGDDQFQAMPAIYTLEYLREA